ncbi:MAG TPA: type II toxin-antitoxin system prevent-host-death family antitoxin [Caulobacterales bacterium]|jgi:prevent-host-death family protein|nr:type II toxin-antitoxin system prevent-host-death family antitoxin [Caulobacterales bacterium]
MSVWQLQTAKAKLSELLRAVREDGPQTISVRGKEEFVVMTKEAAARAEHPVKTGLDLFRPILGLGVDLDIPERRVEEDRPVPFSDED